MSEQRNHASNEAKNVIAGEIASKEWRRHWPSLNKSAIAQPVNRPRLENVNGAFHQAYSDIGRPDEATNEKSTVAYPLFCACSFGIWM